MSAGCGGAGGERSTRRTDRALRGSQLYFDEIELSSATIQVFYREQRDQNVQPHALILDLTTANAYPSSG